MDSVILVFEKALDQMNCEGGPYTNRSSTCPVQKCAAYTASICYRQSNNSVVTATLGYSLSVGTQVTNYTCPSLNLCVVDNCNNLSDYIQFYKGLNGPDEYRIGCKDNGTVTVWDYGITYYSGSGKLGSSIVGIVIIVVVSLVIYTSI